MSTLFEEFTKLSEDEQDEVLLWKDAYLAALSAVAGSDSFSAERESTLCKNHADMFVTAYRAKIESMQDG